MKHFLLALVVLSSVTFNSFGQSGKEDKFSVGIEGGLPVGDLSDYYSYSIGASLKYEYPLAERIFATVSGGINSVQAKTIKYGNSTTFKAPTFNVIPVKAGIKNYFGETFFGEAQVGAAFALNKGVGTAFAYSPGIGYSSKSGFEIGVRYEAWSKNGTDTQMIFRFAPRF